MRILGNVMKQHGFLLLNMVLFAFNSMLRWLLHVFLILHGKTSQQTFDRILLWIDWSVTICTFSLSFLLVMRSVGPVSPVYGNICREIPLSVVCVRFHSRHEGKYEKPGIIVTVSPRSVKTLSKTSLQDYHEQSMQKSHTSAKWAFVCPLNLRWNTVTGQSLDWKILQPKSSRDIGISLLKWMDIGHWNRDIGILSLLKFGY